MFHLVRVSQAQILGSFFKRAATDPEIVPDIQKSGLIIQFEYSDPHSILTIVAATANESNFYEPQKRLNTLPKSVYSGFIDTNANLFVC